jgi:hypothetical protein
MRLSSDLRISLLAFALGVCPSVSARADSCLVRPVDLPDVAAYAVMEKWSTGDMRLLLDEFAFKNTWHKHSDAIAEGFGRGDEVYGESLTSTGEFDKRRSDAWKRNYAGKRHVEYLKRLAPQMGKAKLDRTLVAAMLSGCLRKGAWAVVEPADDCRFTFSAGLWSEEERRKADLRPVKFSVSGGRCEPWSAQPLTTTQASVSCARSGNGTAKVSLELADGTVLNRSVAPLTARRVPDEPVLETGSAAKGPEVEIITLFRSRDYRQVQLARGCPACKLLAADIRPTRAGATIVDIGVVSTTTSDHWFRCPAGLRCGVPEFSPVDQRNVSGCAGQRACRVWRLADDDAEARDAIQITYKDGGETCRNCPEGMDYASAHKAWGEAKDRAQRGCETFADPPVQVLGKARRH